ncbi:MAG: FecR domain-containing protein [Gammaproteobacteria bacterium]|nr:FecR domain-containing protein [Gammaproteobacteria bacterium]
MKQISTLTLILTALSANQAFAESEAGKAMVAKGKVTALQSTDTANEQARKLKRRSLIYSDEVVSTGAKSKAQLRMTDGGMIALKENSELVISDYSYSDENGRGSVAMELIKGGLRSVTGAIKAERGDYNLKTPVGSIGIRGTHYEIEIVQGDVFLAVWDGAVDLVVDTGGGTDTVSFGEGEDFSFARITENGEVTELLEPPENFNEGHSSDTEEDSEQSEDREENNDESTDESDDSEQDSSEEQADNDSDNSGDEETDSSSDSESSSSEDDGSGDEQTPQTPSSVAIVANDPEPEPDLEPVETTDVEVSNEVVESFEDFEDDAPTLATDVITEASNVPVEQLIAERQGSFTYSNVEEVALSRGEINSFDMSMEINFDNGTIPAGTMSFDDDGGEWFVTFGGVISTANIDLDVSFASHGDNLADGEINAAFFDGLDSVIGDFNLQEIKNPDVKVTGSYKIK